MDEFKELAGKCFAKEVKDGVDLFKVIGVTDTELRIVFMHKGDNATDAMMI